MYSETFVVAVSKLASFTQTEKPAALAHDACQKNQTKFPLRDR